MKISKRMGSVSPSPTLFLSAKAKELKRKGEKVINLTCGEPDFDTPSFIKKEAIQAIKEGFTKYTPSRGISELVEEIRRKFKEENGISYSPSEIVVTCGTKQALFSLFQVLCEEGDEVIIPSPYWVSYPEIVKLSGAKPIFWEMDEKFRLRIKELERLLTPRTRALILNSPHNPTGMVWEEEIKEIVKIIEDKPIWLVSDEIYEKLIFEGKHISPAGLGERIGKRTFIINGVSKTYSMTGWRIGYMAGPEKIISKVVVLQSHSTSCPNSIAQRAALGALSGKGGEVGKMREEFKRRRDFLLREWKKISTEFTPPRGTFYFFPKVKEFLGGKIKNSLELARWLLEEKKVAVVPGSAFGREGYLRISFATSPEELQEGVKRIREALLSLKG